MSDRLSGLDNVIHPARTVSFGYYIPVIQSQLIEVIKKNMKLVLILALAALAAAQAPGPSGSNTPFFICDCPGIEAKDYVCGYDGQTYGNDCIRQCANIPLKYKGVCDNKGCFPYLSEKCNANFQSTQQICTIGITWADLAQAQCDGTGQGTQCVYPGPCQYRNDGLPSVLPTTGGPCPDWKAAAANTTEPPRSPAPYDYSEALSKLLLFYDTMISGNLTAPGVCRRRLTWRSDSCQNCIGKYGEDLSGGFYEAGGSSLKYPSIISGFSAAMLAWAGVEFGDAITRAGAMDDLKWKVKWAADHVINAHPQPNVFAGYIGQALYDFDSWSPVEYYNIYNPPRAVGYITAQNPGTEVVADGAATLAAALVLNVTNDTAWNANALQHAEQLYQMGIQYPGSYMDSKDPAIQEMSTMYASNNGYFDDLAWAAFWLYKATGNTTYLDDTKTYLEKAPPIQPSDTFETGYKTPGVDILLAGETKDSKAMSEAKKFFDSYLTDTDMIHSPCGANLPYSWGANRHVGNIGFLSFVHAKALNGTDDAYANRLRNYGMIQTNYLMGSAGRSWIVGFGENYPTQINHKYSVYSILNWNPDPAQEPLAEKMWMTDVAGNWSPENKTGYISKAKFDFEGSRNNQTHTAWGLLFGAPLDDDSLVNSRRDYTYAEPTVEYNSAAFGAAAALADWYQTPAYRGIESLEGVIPFTCDQPQTPWSVGGPVPAPTPGPVMSSSIPSPTPQTPLNISNNDNANAASPTTDKNATKITSGAQLSSVTPVALWWTITSSIFYTCSFFFGSNGILGL